MKDLLRTADLTHQDTIRLLELATELKRDPDLHRDALRGRIVVLRFATPSPGTRLLFEAAVARLGGIPTVLGHDEVQLGRDETIADTARVVSTYADAFVVRTDSDDDIRAIARGASIPVVGALTDGHHPCQSLADLLTIREHLHHFVGRKIAYLGQGCSVAHSLLEAAAIVGMDISIATPAGGEPAPEVLQRAELQARISGASIDVTNDPHLAVKDADVVYSDVRTCGRDSDSASVERRGMCEPFRVTSSLLAEAAPAALFMQCRPAQRSDTADAAVIDSLCSVVVDQAENRLPTAQALLYALVKNELQGS